MDRRALTLIDSLLALVLLGAVLAIAAPALVGRLRPASDRAASAQAASAIELCRVDAMRAQRAIRLVARRSEGSRFELVGVIAEQGGRLRSGGSEAGGRVYLRLPAGYSLRWGVSRSARLGRSGARGACSSSEGDGEFEGIEASGRGQVGHADGPDSEAGRGSGAATLGLFLADGTVIAGRPVVLRRGEAPVARWRINPWSGALEAEPVEQPDTKAEFVQSEQGGAGRAAGRAAMDEPPAPLHLSAWESGG